MADDIKKDNNSVDGLKPAQDPSAKKDYKRSRLIVLESIGETEEKKPAPAAAPIDGIKAKEAPKKPLPIQPAPEKIHSIIPKILPAKPEEKKIEIPEKYSVPISVDKEPRKEGLGLLDSFNFVSAEKAEKKETPKSKPAPLPDAKQILKKNEISAPQKEVPKSAIQLPALSQLRQKGAGSPVAAVPAKKSAVLVPMGKPSVSIRKQAKPEKGSAPANDKRPGREAYSLKRFFNSIRDFFKRLGKLSDIAFAQAIRWMFYFLFFYTAISLAIVRFNVQNRGVQFTNRYLPIPAFYANGKIIDYKLWQIVQEDQGVNRPQDAKTALKRYLVVSELFAKHDQAPLSYEQAFLPQTLDRLKAISLDDKDLNQVAYNRIESIEKMIAEEKDFYRVAEKFGDEIGRVTINESNKSQYSYADQVVKLSPLEQSRIISTVDGYYIFKCFEKKEKDITLSYVFIKNKDFSLILDELVANYRLVNLAGIK